MADVRLSPLLAYRRLGSSVVVVEHGRGEIFELDGAVAPLLDRLERGEQARSDEERTILDALDELGLLAQPDAAGAGHRSVPTSDSEPDEHPDLLEELNRRAARALVPLHAQIELSYRCPLDCDYCYLSPRTAGASPELTTSEIVRLLDELAELGGLFVLLTGGEPCARADLEHIVAAARERRFAVSLLSSGFGLDEPLARRLAERGLDSVQITLHDARAERHDARTRLEGSHEAALRAIRTLRDLGVRTQMAVTVTRANERGLEELRALALELGVRVNLSCNVLPRRDGSGTAELFRASDSGLLAAYRAFPGTAPPRLATRGLDEPPCGAGASTIAVDPFGTVYPCHSLRVPLGSVREKPLATIWHDSRELQALRALRNRDLAGCPDCPDRPHCNRCVGVAVAEGLGLGEHSEQDCRQARLRARLARSAPGAGT